MPARFLVLAIFGVLVIHPKVMAQAETNPKTNPKPNPETNAQEIAPAPSSKAQDSTKFVADPKMTLRYSLIPGGGQWYNRHKWKIPFVYAGMGTAIGFYGYFRYLHNRYNSAYRYKVNAELVASGKAAYNESDLNNADFKAIYDQLSPNATLSSARLKTVRDNATRYRQISALATLGVYALSIAEAYIAANLMDFDVSDTVSLQLVPTHQGTFARLNVSF
jgi:hypothetical protein